MKRFLKLWKHARTLKAQGLLIRRPFRTAFRWWLRGDQFVNVTSFR